jgi:creatinine amidohydrolase/Fe(II)-dependent formamide hydrolase-like protein
MLGLSVPVGAPQRGSHGELTDKATSRLSTSLVPAMYAGATYELERPPVTIGLSCRIHVDVTFGINAHLGSECSREQRTC